MSKAGPVMLLALVGALGIAVIVGVLVWLARAADRVAQPDFNDDGTFNCESMKSAGVGAVQHRYMECVLRKEQIEATNRLAEAMERL